MAKRYRYAFAKKREAQQGKLSAVLAAVSLVLFVTAVLLAFFLQGQYGYIVGGISLCAMLLSVYGFAMGLKSFSEENRTHKAVGTEDCFARHWSRRYRKLLGCNSGRSGETDVV